jgi:hypothetical protein
MLGFEIVVVDHGGFHVTTWPFDRGTNRGAAASH